MAQTLISVLFLLSCVVINNAQNKCPEPDDFSPCTCDIEGINCNFAIDAGEVKQSFKSHVSDFEFRRISISNTEINRLEENTFGKYKFQDLNLQYNKIQIVEDGTFEIMRDFVLEINLSHNLLSSIPQNAFVGLSRVRSIRLEFNLIKVIDVWPVLPSLTILKLENNLLENILPSSFKNLPSLITLDLTSNFINIIGTKAFEGTGSNLLETVKLDDNEITKIEPHAFDGQDNLEWLLLRKNQLKELNSDFWSPFILKSNSTKTQVDLSLNPIECTSNNLGWFLDYPVYLKMFIVGISCKDKPLSELKVSDLE